MWALIFIFSLSLSTSYHCGAVTNKGKLFTWGNYSSGALGQGDDDTESHQPTPKIVESLDNMFVFAIGFGGWQSSVLAIPAYHNDQEEQIVYQQDVNSNFRKTSS